MTQLIHIRQRIKAIETTKKITHAMRLISMSLHAQLKHRAPFVAHYTHAMRSSYYQIWHATKEKIQPPQAPLKQKNRLIFIIGSQKGLCGNFNVYLLYSLKEYHHESVDLIVIGKKILEYAQHQQHTILRNYPDLSLRTLFQYAQKLTTIALEYLDQYEYISILSNIPKTFFIQKPHLRILMPFPPPDNEVPPRTEYYWQQDQQEVYAMMLRAYLQASFYQALFESLLAEQAARFISMDAATRNAKKLLEVTKLQYNKFRQSIITKELTELSGNY
jgi:F-type H+-transporting ATPase subunit gamma